MCRSEEEREEAEGGNGNGELGEEWVVHGWDDAGSGSIDGSGVIFHCSSGGLVEANLGAVSVGGVNNSHEVSTAELSAGGWADGIVGSAVGSNGSVGGIGSAWNSNDKGEGNEDGGGFHFGILFAVN